MATKGKVYKGLPSSAAMLAPWVAPRHLSNQGQPLGIDLRTRKVVVFDPWALQVQRIIHSTIILILGDKNHGKTTLMQSLTLRLMALQAGHLNGTPVEMRSRIHNRKPENGQPEYKPLTDFLESPTFSLNKSRLFNLFDPSMGMSAWDLLETAVNACETSAEHPLTGWQPLNLQVAVYKMLRDFRDVACPEILEVILRGIDISDVKAYYDASDNEVLNSLDSVLADRLKLRDQLQLTMKRPNNIPRDEFLRDAGLASTYIGRILRGDFGRMFGGQKSLRSQLTLPMSTWDWTDVNPRGASLLEAMLWKWNTVALSTNDVGIIPHINLGDEESDGLNNLMHARFMAAFVKKARAFHTADLRATQYQSDIRNAGAVGSEMRGHVESILLGTGLRFIGRQPKNDAVLNDLGQLGISDLDLEYFTTMPVGCWGIKVADQPMIIMQHILTPTESRIFTSNAASKRMTDRVPVLSTEAMRQRAIESGIIKVGQV